ncbi:MAG: right-handed parallel beta-helix repeat-containing protein [Verrucomicrobiota bacterium JB024]|nr:right-handed parallel beta-helix repeat-containing protein [Verrucomicrobiota bacterium JB024]
MQTTLAQEPAVLKGTELGLVPDTGEIIPLETVRRAVARVAEESSARLVLEPGRYDFAAPADPSEANVFDFSSATNLEIDGQGALLVFRGKATAFRFTRSRDVRLSNVQVDWDVPPFAQGTITASGEDYIDVRLDPGYPYAGERIEGLMDYDPETRLPIGNFDMFRDYILSVERVEPETLRLTFDIHKHADKTEYVRQCLQHIVGNKVILRYSVYGHYGVLLTRCEDVRLEGVRIYTVPGMAVQANRCEGLTLDRVEVRPRPGTDWLMSTTADCIFLTHCTGEILIQDCHFEATGDDGLNITGAKYWHLSQMSERKNLLVAPPPGVWEGPVPEPGDVLEFAGARDLVVVAKVPVRQAVWNPKTRLFEIELTEPLPDNVRLGDFVVSRRYCGQAKIVRSTYRGIRSRAIVLSADDVVIENCYFEGMPEPAIMLKGGDRHHQEGPVCNRIFVRNNVFERVGGPVVQASAGATDPGADVVHDVVIEGNVVLADPAFRAKRVFHCYDRWAYLNSGLSLASITGMSIRNNVFDGLSGNVIFLDRVSDVDVEGNRSLSGGDIVVDEGTCSSVRVGANPGLTLSPNENGYYTSHPRRISDLR